MAREQKPRSITKKTLNTKYGAEKLGMICPSCSKTDGWMRPKPRPMHGYIKRTVICAYCGYTTNSIETLEDPD